MMDQPDFIDDLRSEDVQEVLGTPPPWIIRWGSAVAFAIVVALGWLAFWVKYPDVVEADIRITTSDPPRRLFAEEGNTISRILVANEDTVERGQVLLVFQSKAKFEDVLSLEDHLLSFTEINDSTLLRLSPPQNLLLGDLQDDLFEFFDQQNAFRQLLSKNPNELSVSDMRRRIQQLLREMEVERSRKEKLASQLDLVNQRLSITRTRLRSGESGVSFDDVRRIEEDILALEREMQGIEAAMRNKQFEIDNLKRQIGGAKEVGRESLVIAGGRLEESYMRLQNKVEDWKERYLVSAPIPGIVIFTNENLNEQQYVPEQSELMVVAPAYQTETLGRMTLDLSGSGKVKPGQKVVVKLSSFPFPEFGALIGRVSWKGTVPTNNTIPIEVRFPQGLQTHTGIQIDAVREMRGKAEIITEDKRFIERIFEGMRRLTN